MRRWAAIDYGARRIGLALADPGESIASPDQILEGAGSALGDARRILAWAARNEVTGFVVGLPLNMDGSDSAQTRRCRDFANCLRKRTDLAVELWDERLSTFQADERLSQTHLSPAQRRRRRDALAAQVILQSFLDARRQPRPPDDSPAPDPP